MRLHIYLKIIFYLPISLSWNVDSWKKKPSKQIPVYKDKRKLERVEYILSKKPPLVISTEIDTLKDELIDVQNGERFIFMGGDCAETFREHSAENIINNYQLFILSTIILMSETGKKITKISRSAGQFSKPRSSSIEFINDMEIPVYKGDMINRENFNLREPDPYLMIRAYQQSTETINLIRALSSSHKYSNININNWKSDFVSNIYKTSYIDEFLNSLQYSINLLSSSELENSVNINCAQLYTGHEGLLLNYEKSLTRKDRFTSKYYDCSSHFIWIGERTRQLNHAHVEFFRGINNPIGIKISHKIEPNELIDLILTLNPKNEKGKICLITRMGTNIKKYLPTLIDTIEKQNLNVIWICDPMHGNGKNINGIKTRYFEDIMSEINHFFDIHHQKGTIPGGIHLEMTSNDVTECIGGKYILDNKNFLEKKYLSSCDPRLNFFQTIELIQHVSKIII